MTNSTKKTQHPRSIFGALMLTDDAVNRVSLFAGRAQEDPVRVGRRLFQIVKVMGGALLASLAACVAIWALPTLSTEGQVALALTLVVSSIVFLASFFTFFASTLQALIVQHITISECTLDVFEAEGERCEVEETLREVREILEPARGTHSPSQLEEILRKTLSLLDRPNRPGDGTTGSFHNALN